MNWLVLLKNWRLVGAIALVAALLTPAGVQTWRLRRADAQLSAVNEQLQTAHQAVSVLTDKLTAQNQAVDAANARFRQLQADADAAAAAAKVSAAASARRIALLLAKPVPVDCKGAVDHLADALEGR